MSAFLRALVGVLACLSFWPLEAAAWDRGEVERFATLPAGAPNPEGIAADRHGNIYASGFDPVHSAGPGKVFVFDEDGRLLRTLRPAGTSNALLGMGFNAHGDLLVIDFGQGKVFKVNPETGASSLFTAVPSGPPAHGLNALTFDHVGNVYISDSFQGAVWVTGPAGGAATVWKQDPLLTTSGFPPFGANGLQFNNNESALFVANTGNDTVVRIENAGPVTGGDASVFTNSINGADGLMIDEDDNVWVCANQADEIVVTDKTGKAIAKIGDFNGIRNGSPVGFLFPASLVRSGNWVFVTNLSLDLRPITGQQAVDSQWAAQVTVNTLSRIPARLPRPQFDND